MLIIVAIPFPENVITWPHHVLPGQTVSDVIAVAAYRPAGSDRPMERGSINRYVAVPCRSAVCTFGSSLVQSRPYKIRL